MYILQNFLQHLQLNRIRYVIIADECHHIAFGTSKTNYLKVEVLGLTASEERDKNTEWDKTFLLESVLLRSHLKPLEFVRYNYTGLTEYQRTAIKQSLHNVKKKITKGEQKRIMQQSMYGELLEYSGSFQVEKKRFVYDRASVIYLTDVFLEILMRTPKVVALVALAWKIKQRGEKLVVFDTSETGLSLLHLVLRSNNIISYPFVTDYSPKERSNLIKKFQKDGDVILGSIGMLGEGQNITEANHFTFIGNPNNAEQFKQAVGRLSRFPQEKQVYLHILASCAIEEYFILNFIAGNYESVDKSEIFEFISEFID
jgi:superfamily II DNA or RNA helicase